MWSGVEIGALIITCGSVFVSILSQIQNSKCTQITLGCGLFSCSRQVPDVESAVPTIPSVPAI